MFILDYEDRVAVAGPDGVRHAALLTGYVEPDAPGRAGLGHSPTALAYQSWKEVSLRTEQRLDFEVGRILFVDGSERVAELSLKDESDGFHYAVVLGQ